MTERFPQLIPRGVTCTAGHKVLVLQKVGSASVKQSTTCMTGVEIVKLSDHITMCWNLVLRNRRRYKAVIAAIAFGTAGFIIVRTMGSSVESNLGQHLELLGEATVMKVHWDKQEDAYHPGKYHMKDVVRLRDIPHVRAVAPIVSLANIDAYVGPNESGAGLMGIDQSVLDHPDSQSEKWSPHRSFGCGGKKEGVRSG